MPPTVVIDCFPERARAYKQGYDVVVVDVIRATTLAITVVANGGRCFPVSSVADAHRLALRFANPLLAGELGGERAPGFEMNNSPAELAARRDLSRSVILVSSSGTKLIQEAKSCEMVHLACLRNSAFLAHRLAGRSSRVAIIGAGSRGEFREEDQMCCAWIARDLIRAGYRPENGLTARIVKRWQDERPAAIVEGKSASYLRRSGQLQDLDFILSHINDLTADFVLRDEEVVLMTSDDRVATPHRGVVDTRRETSVLW